MIAKRVCCIFNFAPHYREDIYRLIDENFDCQFYFGDKTYASIKKLDYANFKNPVTELKFKKLFSKFYFLKGQSKLSSKEFDYYIITGQPYNLSHWLLLLKNKIKGNKTFLWNHGLYGKENFFSKYIKKLQFHFINGYFLYSRYAKQVMIKEGYNEGKLHVIYNSLKYFQSSKIRPNLIKNEVYKDHFRNEFPNLIFIGRLTKVKKLELLIQALRKSTATGVNYNLTIIGDGAIKQSLEIMIHESNLESKIWLYGASYNEAELAQLIYNADLCVSPGNIGLTAIHSLSYGTPAITHNNFSNQMPEFESVIEGVTGDFFEENSIESLQKTIENWLSRYPEKNKKIINKCYTVIDDFYNPYFQVNVFKEILS